MTLRLAMVSPFPEIPGVVRGGVEGVAYCLTKSLIQSADIDIHILAPCVRRNPGIEQRDDMTIHWLPDSRMFGFLAYWSTFRKTIHRCLEKIKPDITHFQGLAGWTLNYHRPYVLTIHGIAEKDVLYKGGPLLYTRHKIIALIERLGRQRTQYAIIINPYVLDEIGEQVKGQRWHIENPVTAEFFELKRENTIPRILFVGRISHLKNVDGLIRAFKLVRSQIPDVTLHIAGSPEQAEYHTQCMRYVHEHGLEQAIRFLGNLNRSLLQVELSRATCLALVSHQETAPMIVGEAMAAGVPVVASRLCGLPYMIDEEKTGFLVDPTHEDEIASKLIILLRDDRTNREMGKLCREVARRFHPISVAGKTFEVYKHILNNWPNH